MGRDGAAKQLDLAQHDVASRREDCLNAAHDPDCRQAVVAGRVSDGCAYRLRDLCSGASSNASNARPSHLMLMLTLVLQRSAAPRRYIRARGAARSRSRAGTGQRTLRLARLLRTRQSLRKRIPAFAPYQRRECHRDTLPICERDSDGCGRARRRIREATPPGLAMQ